MKFRFFLTVFLPLVLANCVLVSAQSRQERPALVIGIVVDQMRQDLLFRYSAGFGEGGFKRMLREGYSFSGCHYSYIPTYTGPGHASIYTGTTPALHGIVGNNWMEQDGKIRYCTQDEGVKGLGGIGKHATMSPSNMQAGSVADQVRLHSNFRGKAFGIALKDRGAILPAGHAANAAFWFDYAKGNFISSDWYRDLNGKLPVWLEKFNASGFVKSYLDSVWKPLLPLPFYNNQTDLQPWEKPLIAGRDPVFPYRMKDAGGFDKLASSPFGNRITNQLAMKLIEEEKLGVDAFMDFLAISYSSTDIVGHAYGPSAMETEDCYLRLDRDLEALFQFLDSKVGKGKYLCFLTADHGVMDVPAYLKSHQIPAYTFSEEQTLDSLRAISRKTSGKDWLAGLENLQLSWKKEFFELKEEDRKPIESDIIRWLEKQDGILRAFQLYGTRPWPEPPFLDKIKASWYPGRSGHIQILLKSAWLNQPSEQGTTHGSPYAYDSHVPCLWMGWKVAAGEDARPMAIEDIAPSLSALLHIGLPSASTGRAQNIPLINKP